MWDWLKITEIFKNKILLVTISVVSGLISFKPNLFLQFGLNEVITPKIKSYILIIFLFSSVYLAVSSIHFLWNLFGIIINTPKFSQKKVKDYLKNLDFAEKAVLREFFVQNKNIIQLPKDNSAVAGLISIGILKREGNIGRFMVCGYVFNYRINPLIKDLVTTDVVGISLPITNEVKEWVLENRPSFIRTIMNFNSFYN